ncbi:unnamed protein product [Chondrus crispus]|uniref:Uncharacterized protein n=1 Tax=Chondrus crispus TaxID=2769 RepID=R7QNH9_CHOCR|nr:unnamed protein product [Chondrus crispus]CDF38940.1 unnamed protein product [Chondrus crispus]|eukprot:XP_005718845.1 unnamed protein product [Chondrus crispus]
MSSWECYCRTEGAREGDGIDDALSSNIMLGTSGVGRWRVQAEGVWRLVACSDVDSRR